MTTLESFFNYLQYEKRSSGHTITAYKKDLDQFILFGKELVEDFCVETVDYHLIRQWIIALMNSGIIPRSIKRKISTLKSYYKFLFRQGIILKMPTDKIATPKVPKKIPLFVQEKEMDKLFERRFFQNDFAGWRDKAVISLFYGTGIRLAELKKVKFSDINLAEKTVKVTGKGNKQRIVPFPTEVSTNLQNYINLRNELFGQSISYLFITDKGEPIYDKMLYRIVKRHLTIVSTLEKRSPHILRHSYATHLLNRGAELNAIKELLGHSSLAATQIYTHTTFEKIKNSYKQAHPWA